MKINLLSNIFNLLSVFKYITTYIQFQHKLILCFIRLSMLSELCFRNYDLSVKYINKYELHFYYSITLTLLFSFSTKHSSSVMGHVATTAVVQEVLRHKNY